MGRVDGRDGAPGGGEPRPCRQTFSVSVTGIDSSVAKYAKMPVFFAKWSLVNVSLHRAEGDASAKK
jgi:hypothetical protein